MTKPIDSEALARAYAAGVEEGLRFAFERVSAYLLCLDGDPHSYFADIIAGRITGEMVLERRREKAQEEERKQLACQRLSEFLNELDGDPQDWLAVLMDEAFSGPQTLH